MPTPELLLGQVARDRMKHGFDTLAHLLALTLGPSPRTILATSYQRDLPEAFDDAATIARRFVGMPNRAENAGAMLLRNLVWRQHQRSSDGCAITAVLAQALLAESHRMLAAGISLAALRAGIEQSVASVLETLRGAARPLAGDEELQALVKSICSDQPLSLLVSELFDLLGAEAAITIEQFAAPYLDRDYIEGGRWKAQLASGYFAQEPTDQPAVSPGRAIMRDAAVVLFAGNIQTLDDLVPLLELLAAAEHPKLLLVARHFSELVLTTLVVNHQRDIVRTIAVELRELGERCDRDFEDLAALTGAQLIDQQAGDRLGNIGREQFGRARRVEADHQELLVSGWRAGAPVRQRILSLQERLAALAPSEREQREELRERIGRLSHGTATLKIGASSEIEREMLQRRAEQCLRAVPAAMRSGILPGGGVAYLQAAEKLADLALSGEQNYGVAAVRRALEAPFRQIVTNGRMRDPSATLAEVRRHQEIWGYDALRNRIAPVAELGLFDSAETLCEALRTAASGALMALTTEALVLKRNPEMSYEP